MDLTSKIVRAVTDLSKTEVAAERWIRPVGEVEPAGSNHFVLFMKPELLAVDDDVNVEAALELVLSALKKHAVEIGAIRVLNGRYLARHRIMEEHYGVINRVSRLGDGALSQPTRKKLLAECPGADSILGGHEFLQKFPDVSAFALNLIADTLGTKRIASGKYYSVIEAGGERIIVLNSFHPQQLLHYTRRGRTVVVFECATDTHWRVLRHEMTGTTDPKRAAEGSIRRTLLEKKDKLGLADVRTATNGVHCSAGPLEAMVEYSRFFSKHAGKNPIKLVDTPFGQLLKSRGLTSKDIASLAKNPMLDSAAGETYAFNATEDKDADESADLLAGMTRRAAS